jgi:hypothetical protein
MIEILQRGPDRRSGQRPGERGGGFSAGYEPDRGGPNRGGGYDADNTMVHGSGSPGSSQYGIPDDHPAADHGPGDYGPGDYDPRDRGPSDYDPRDRGPSDYDPRDRGPGDYDPRDRGPGDYGDAGYRGSESRAPRHRTERYEPADYGRPDYEEEPPREWWQENDYADRTGQRFVPGDEARYGQQRFEPPNRRPRPDSSERGFMDDPEYRQPADPASRPRHSAGRHSGGQGQ